MAPFRNRDRSNRSGRGQIEHNVLEGLPINQYREVEVTVGANSADNKPTDKDAWPELPMPKDSHMLPDHSQQLLRAARSGRVYKPPAPPEDDNEMKDEEEEHKEVQTGFTIKKYVKVARHLEVSEPEYLAKRRKGMPSPYVPNGVPQPAVRETKVKKVDAEGNATVYKVLVPEGQAVEGEVQPTDAAIEVAPAAAVPGTVVEGVGVVNAEGVVVANDILQQTPPKRRVPPPKKKRGGPGRGKKRVVFIEGAAEQGTPSASAGGELPAISGIKAENGSVEPSDGDTPMGEAGGEDDEGSGEEGSEDDEQDGDHLSAPMTPAKPSVPSIAPTSVPDLEAANLATLEAAAPTEPSIPVLEQPVQQDPMDVTSVPQALIVEDAKQTKDPSSSPDLPLSAVAHSRQNSLTQSSTSKTEPEPELMSLDPIESGNIQEPAIVAPPVLEPIMPSVVEATIEQATEAPLEQNVEPVVEAPHTPPTEPVIATIEPVAVPPVEPVTDATSAPVIESIAEPTAETIAEPSAESVVQPIVQPVAEPLVKPLPEVTSAVEPESTSIQATEAEQVPAPPTEQVSAPPSEPDLMGSLEKHLENND